MSRQGDTETPRHGDNLPLGNLGSNVALMLFLVFVSLFACLLVSLSARLCVGWLLELFLSHRSAPDEDVCATVRREVFDRAHLAIGFQGHGAELLQFGERHMGDFAIENNVLVWRGRQPVNGRKRLPHLLGNLFAGWPSGR